jgi:hypothetical protein
MAVDSKLVVRFERIQVAFAARSQTNAFKNKMLQHSGTAVRFMLSLRNWRFLLGVT